MTPPARRDDGTLDAASFTAEAERARTRVLPADLRTALGVLAREARR